MRLPRVRTTIGRLMLAIFLVGLASWGLFFLRPRLAARAIAEQPALARLQQAKLAREVAEYALREYAEGVSLQERAALTGRATPTRADVERLFRGLSPAEREAFLRVLRQVEPIRPPGAGLSLAQEAEQAGALLSLYQQDREGRQIRSLEADIARAQADELACAEAMRAFRARYWRALLGF